MIVGIDPGPAVTACVVLHDQAVGDIDDSRVLGHKVWRKPDLDPHGLRKLATDVDDLIATCAYLSTPGVIRIYLEAVKAPNPHLGMTNVEGVLRTAEIIGVLIGVLHPTPVLVPPANFGKAPLYAYPKVLCGRDRTGTGKSPSQHLRAAYDCALAGAANHRLEAAS